MTSRVSYFKIIIHGMKRHLWYGAVCFLMFFIGFPLNAMLRFESVDGVSRRLSGENRISRIGTLQHDFSVFAGAGDYLIMFLVLGMALLGAWCGLSWLHSRKKMDLMGSLPVKREKLFLAESISVLLLFAVPYVVNLILALVAGAAKGIFTGKALMLSMVALGIHFLYFLVLYLCAATAMLLTGKILAGILGTLVFLGIAPISYAVTFAYRGMFLETYVSGSDLIGKLVFYTSPAGSLFEITNRMMAWSGVKDGKIIIWIPLLAAAVMGIVFAALSIWLIKIRPAEGAEQSMVFPKTEGIIKACILYPLGLGGGLFFAGLGYVSEEKTNLWLWFGMAFALFLGSILIEVVYHLDRKRIFEHKLWTGIGVGAVLLTASVFVFDLTGYDRWLPDQEDVEHAVSYMDVVWGEYPDGIQDSYEYMEKHLEEFPADGVYELAKAGVAHLDNEEEMEGTVPVTVVFRMKNGKIKSRCYQVSYEEAVKAERQMYQADAYREGMFPLIWKDSAEISGVELSLGGQDFTFNELNREKMRQFVEIYRDELKTLSYEELYDVDGGVLYFYDLRGSELSNVRYPLNTNFEQTVAFLRKNGRKLEFSFKEKEVQKLTFRDYRSQADQDAEVEAEDRITGDMTETVEAKVMEDPKEIAMALEGLVSVEGLPWYMSDGDAFCHGLEVLVEYTAENGDLITVYGVYRTGEVPSGVEAFLKGE
ncbi:MAG: hypothetical protein KH828_12040 [Clostridiales bacterium]|nr:hypothetical protein [Clostridiales bacterium]